MQVRLLHDGRERGRMYACYALSSVLSTKAGVTEIRAAGVIPALIHVLNSTTVIHTPICVIAKYCLIGIQLSTVHATSNDTLTKYNIASPPCRGGVKAADHIWNAY